MYMIGMVIIIFEILYGMGGNEFELTRFYCILGMLFAQFCQACNLISQERFLKRLDSTSGAANGMKGIIGLILTCIFYIPIHDFMINVRGEIEKPSNPIFNLRDSSFFIPCIFWILVLCLLNFFFSKILKFSEAINACNIDSARILIIWIVSLLLSFSPVMLVDIFGGLLIVFGSMVYNGFIVLSYCGMKESLEEEIAENFPGNTGINYYSIFPLIKLTEEEARDKN